jgi:hypothetical protein
MPTAEEKLIRCVVQYVCEIVFFILSNEVDPECISVFRF